MASYEFCNMTKKCAVLPTPSFAQVIMLSFYVLINSKWTLRFNGSNLANLKGSLQKVSVRNQNILSNLKHIFFFESKPSSLKLL